MWGAVQISVFHKFLVVVAAKKGHSLTYVLWASRATELSHLKPNTVALICFWCPAKTKLATGIWVICRLIFKGTVAIVFSKT